MKPRAVLLALPLASLIACQPESPVDHPKSPEFIGSTIAGASPYAIDTSIPGLIPGSSYQEEGIDYNDGDELDVDPRYAQDMFYICETLGEESDRCDEWETNYGG